jgi:dolichol-phosphate mannosyltransferase
MARGNLPAGQEKDATLHVIGRSPRLPMKDFHRMGLPNGNANSAGQIVSRMVRFGLVGLSGVGVNLGVFHLVRAVAAIFAAESSTTGFVFAESVGIVTSIATNFWLNDHWTWGDLRDQVGSSVWQRLFRFYAVAFVGAGVNLSVALIIRSSLAVQDTIAVLGGIAAAMAVNFTFNQIWTFRVSHRSAR